MRATSAYRGRLIRDEHEHVKADRRISGGLRQACGRQVTLLEASPLAQAQRGGPVPRQCHADGREVDADEVRPELLGHPQAGTAVAAAEVHHGVPRPHVQRAHQALQGRA